MELSQARCAAGAGRLAGARRSQRRYAWKAGGRDMCGEDASTTRCARRASSCAVRCRREQTLISRPAVWSRRSRLRLGAMLARAFSAKAGHQLRSMASSAWLAYMTEGPCPYRSLCRAPRSYRPGWRCASPALGVEGREQASQRNATAMRAQIIAWFCRQRSRTVAALCNARKGLHDVGRCAAEVAEQGAHSVVCCGQCSSIGSLFR